MTWGEIRGHLARRQPDLDALDTWLRLRYEQILDAHNWRQLHAEGAITTVPAYREGMLTVTEGSPAVSLTGGTWTAAMSGLRMQVFGTGGLYRFTRTTDTTGTLDRPYEGSDAVTAGYVLFENIYALAPDCRKIVDVLDPLNGLPAAKFTRAAMRKAVGQLVVLGPPAAWAPATDADGVRRVEVFYAPDRVYTLPYSYQHILTGYDPADTTTSPVDWIPAKLILDGVLADIAADGGVLAAKDRYEADFEKGLAKLRFLDRQGEPQSVLELARHWNTAGGVTRRYGRTGNFRLP